LVEDNEDDVIMTEPALRVGKVKNPVSILRDGEEAARLPAEDGEEVRGRCDAGDILLDFHMPKLDGFEVLSIKNDEQLLENGDTIQHTARGASSSPGMMAGKGRTTTPARPARSA
jgi:CheY-like chemotaxis protein